MEKSTGGTNTTSWIERHTRGFILNGLRGSLSLPPAKCNHRPASDCRFPELGIIKSALKSWKHTSSALYSGQKLPSVWNYLADRDQFMFESRTGDSFPLLQNTDIYSSHYISTYQSHAMYSGFTLVHTMIKNSVRDLRKRLPQGCKVILLGRDVWLWAVLCEKMNVPYSYSPSVSRNVVYSEEALRQVMRHIPLADGDILFDTGFAGTIHKYVSQYHSNIRLENVMFSAANKEFQQFRNYGLARNRALVIEYLPKYYNSARIWDGKVVQELASFREFLKASVLTILFWYHESPAWLPGPKFVRVGDRSAKSYIPLIKSYW